MNNKIYLLCFWHDGDDTDIASSNSDNDDIASDSDNDDCAPSFLTALRMAATGVGVNGDSGNPVWMATWMAALWFVGRKSQAGFQKI